MLRSAIPIALSDAGASGKVKFGKLTAGIADDGHRGRFDAA
jgi:hypothetical protein